MKTRHWMKKGLSALLALIMVLQCAPLPSLAAESDNLCDHHPEHTAACGYAVAVAEVPCTHVHDESCGYVEAVAEVLCACVAAEDGTLTHAEGCGYVAPVTGAECTHAHDDACGYAAAVEAHECHYECIECAALISGEETDPSGEPTTEPAEEPAEEPTEEPTAAPTEPAAEATAEVTTEPGAVCTCESDDPDWHAPFCEAYTAPENPECFCVEACGNGAANEWCDVCYFDPADCAASGGEEAAVYASVPTYISKIAVSYGAKESTPKDILSNNGFTVVDYDLNKGCGASSHYIYLGYKLTNDPSQAITGIFARAGNNPPASATFDGVTAYLLGGSEETNPGENKAVDLNADAGGDYIYFYVTRDTSRAPITEITFDGNSSKSGYVTPNVNLNKGTSGGSIYLHYKQFSATVKATYHYLDGIGNRVNSTQSATVKNHLEKMTKVPSYPTTVIYEGRTFAMDGWREDDKADVATVKTGATAATYLDNEKTYRAIYFGTLSLSYDANGGSGAPAMQMAAQRINAGSTSVVKQSATFTIPDDVYTHPSKCFMGLATGKTATTAAYQPGDSITISSDTVLYAVYKDHSFNSKGICTVCGALDHTCRYTNGFCYRCDDYETPALANGYYQITNGGNLFWFAEFINTVDRTANARLTKDIDLENRAWTPIGSTGEANNNFRGHFDGQGHTIRGLYVQGGRSGLGFFGEVRLGTVENFTIYGDVVLVGKHDYVGGVIGSAPGASDNQPDHNGATIRNITSYVNVTLGEGSHGSNRVGGFLGYVNHETLIENCSWYGTLDLGPYRAQDGVGGLVGKANDNSAVTIRNCGAYGTIKTAYQSGSYNSQNTIYIGGIVSNSVASARTNIENTLWAGTIVDNTNLGTNAHISAFGTLNGTGSVTNCYARDNAAYLTTNGTHDSFVTAVTDAQLASGEVAYKLGAAWGQTIGSNAYPILGGQKVYCGYADCLATEKSYANTPLAEAMGVHSYENGFCTFCKGYQPATGDGTQDNPYKIGNAGQLYWFAAVVNKGYGDVRQKKTAWAVLTDDITVNTDVLKGDGTLNGDGSGFLPWTPIGNSESRYIGTFDGNGKTVSGLYVNENTDYVGLFGRSGGTVKNVGVVDSYISGSKYVGGVVGTNNGTVESCYNAGSVSGGDYVGGVVGHNSGGTTTGCYNTGSVSGSKYVGGVVGRNNPGSTVVNSYNIGTVSGSDYIGGVVGSNNGTVESCHNTGIVSGSFDVGGVVGYNSGTTSTVESCYNTGSVSGSKYVGGVVGYNNSGTVTGCYNEGTINGSDQYAGGVAGYNNSSTVESCYNAGSVSGGDYVGGVVSYNTGNGTVEDCYNTGNVSGSQHVGGLVGGNYNGPVVNSHNIGSVSGSSYVGGLVGENYNQGTVVNCYYDSDIYSGKVIGADFGTATDVLGKSTADFASGMVAYLLSRGCTVGETVYSGEIWGQNIDGEGEKDAYPVFSDATVYQVKNCNGDAVGYSNTDGKQLDHTYDNGFCTVCGGFQSATGDGTQDNPYKIGNAGQLYWFAAVVNEGYGGVAQNAAACAELTANITVNADVLKEDGTLNGDGSGFLPWTPIGETSRGKYIGTFDGKEYTVSGLYINENTNYVGLFGYSDGTVKNVGVVDSYLSGSGVGGVVGSNDGIVTNCYNTGSVNGSFYDGGVVGANHGTVTNCYNEGTVSSSGSYVGGVVGFNQSNVTNCYNTGSVRNNAYVAGVVGANLGTVVNCYNTGSVSGQGFAGGVASVNLGTVVNSYNSGSVSGKLDVGGVANENRGTVVNCYYDSDIYSGKVIGADFGTATDVLGKSTADFASGMVAYLLSRGCTVGETVYSGEIWGQNIDGDGEKDAYPLFSDAKVYPAKNCDGSDGIYSNTQDVQKDHIYSENGFCTFCDGYESPTGSGTVYNPYQISNAGQLYWFAAVVNTGYGDVAQNTAAWAVLTDNITVNTGVLAEDGTLNNDYSNFLLWTPIGNSSNMYTGTFDGKGFTIGGMYVNSNTNYVGLFGYLYGTVKNVGIVDSYFSGSIYIGSVVGVNYSGTVEACYNEGSVAGNRYVGGVVGENKSNGKVVNCYNTGSVNGSNYYVGGVVGYNNTNSTVVNSYNTGSVNSSSDYVGGVVGYNNSGTVENCHNTGIVSGSIYVGGVVGYNNSGTVENCHNTGIVSGSNIVGGVVGGNKTNGKVVNSYNTGSVNGSADYVGGVVGYNDRGAITLCYNEGSVSGNNDVGGVVGCDIYGTVTLCYNEGSVSGSNYVGGVAGYSNSGIVENCYNEGLVSGSNRAGGVVGRIFYATVVNCYNSGNVGDVAGSNDSGNVGGVVGSNESGTVANCYYDSTVCGESAIGENNSTAVDVLGKTTAQFASGEVAYLLSRGCTLSEGEAPGTYPGDVWGQNIDGEGEKDAYPVFSDAKVYPAKNCDGSDGIYSNTQDVQKDHIYNENGFCANFGCYQPATGSGTESDPYKIGNAGQLYWFAAVVNEGYGDVERKEYAYAELTADITVNENVLAEDGTLNGDGSGFLPWTPIGNGDRSNSNYTGTFNGNGKTVSGLYFDNSTASCAGLFGWSRGTVKNVGVVDSYLSGSYYVGGVVGQNDGAVLSSYNSGAVSGSDYYVGGVVGFNSGTVEDCYNTGAVSGYRYVGGVVGSNDGAVEDCYNTGAVSGSGYVGGVVGYNSGTVANCYNTGAVSGSRYVGGVAGINNSGTVLNSYNTGSVSGSYQYVGGVVGHNSGTVEDCYNTGTVSGSDNYVGGVVGENYGTVVNSHNIGSVSGSNYVGGVVGYNYYGTVVNCYYDSDIYIGTAISSDEGTSTDVWGKTTADFASGEVAYLLSRGCTVGNITYSGDVWGQNIDGEGQKDAYPVFSDARVYRAKNCMDQPYGYSNTEGKPLGHSYENGFCLFCNRFAPATGSGTENDPYKIGNAGQLYWFAAEVNDGDPDAWAELTADIVVNENVLKEDGTLSDDSGDFRVWTPIGKDAKNMYTGTFDGKEFTVSGLYSANSSIDNVGLFGYVAQGGIVKNVGVKDSYLSGGYNVGGLVGISSGTVEGCYNTGTVRGSNYVGGVVSSNSGTVEGCYNTGSVSGSNYVGGVVGSNSGTVANCYNTGAVSGSGNNVGGVVGYNSGTVANCYNTGAVSGSRYVGSVVGYNSGTVANCYNTGAVNGSRYVGGVAGDNRATVESCYNTGSVSGDYYVGGVAGINNSGTVLNSYNTGSVRGSGNNVGGVVGNNYSTVANCYNTGSVSGSDYVGGVVGENEATVESCYNSGSVIGTIIIGGVVGYNYEGTVGNSHNIGSVSGSNYVGGVVGYNCEGTVVNSYSNGSVSGSHAVGGVVGDNIGPVVNCYYDSDIYSGNAIGSDEGTSTNVLGKTTAEFASGAVTYSLSQGCTVGEGEAAVTYPGDVWGQNIDGEGEKDAYPVFSDARVYRAKNCKGETDGYSNTDGGLVHSYENGFCTLCGGFQPATGSGTESDPYKIGNAGQLYWFAAKVNDGDPDAWAVLTANITVNTGDVAGCNGTKAEGWKDWTPIGKDYDTQYAGTFDGKEFTVSGLYFDNSSIDNVGLFRYSGGTVKNVGVVASYFHGNECVGGVVGYNTGTVESCYNTGTVSGSSLYIGGVVGYNTGTVESCYNTGTVSGSKYVGGVVGNNSGTTSTVESCYNTGTVSGSGDVQIGGVVGNNDGTVESCYNAGSVSGTGTGTRTGIGGVTGYNYGTVEGCYNAGPVSGSSKVGGVVGLNVKGTVVGCYNIGTVSGRYAVGGVVGDNTGGDRRSVVTNCYNTGAVSASGESVGGVAGSNGGDISCCYNTGTVSGSSKVGGVVGYNGAGFTVINSYNNSDAFSGEAIGLNDGTAVDVLNKTGAQFASGEVAYLLQGEQTQQIWGQNVDGEGEKDAYPIFSEVKVYPVSCCLGRYGGYSNTEGKQQAPKYNENGFCIYCGGYESATGSGTERDPYKIGNAGQLYWFAAAVNGGDPDAWAVLTANITVNEAVLKADGSLNDGTFQAWTPISGLEERYFGTFDGNGFAVSGLYFHDTTAQYAGLFGFLEGDAVVRNVGVVDSYISGGICVGAVAGVNMGTVEGCYNAGTVIVGESDVGGIVGQNGFLLTNCYNTGAVSGNGAVGGVAGQNGGFLTNCYNAGPVSGNGENIGSVTGFNVGTVANCYYDSTVYSGAAFGNNYGTAIDVMGKSAAEFASGQVAYLLSRGITLGEGENAVTYPGDGWGQNLDNGQPRQDHPVISDARVYLVHNCQGNPLYSNTDGDIDHDWSNGNSVCANCGTACTHNFVSGTCTICGAAEKLLSVEIAWGALTFTYDDAVDEVTGQEKAWTDSGTGWVMVTNTGNANVTVTYTYETERTDILGSFADDAGPVTAPVTVAPEQISKIWLILANKPDQVLNSTTIGTVKLLIQ